MERVTEVVLLPVKEWLRSLVLGAAVLSTPDREVFVANPDYAADEIAALKMLASRMPVAIFDAVGDPSFTAALRSEPCLDYRGAVDCGPADLAGLVGRFGPPRGLVSAPADSLSRCIKAAMLAVRLGYMFLPDDPSRPSQGPPAPLPHLWLGSEAERRALPGRPDCGRIAFLPNHRAMVDYLKKEGLAIDYLVVLNSADLVKQAEPDAAGRSLGDLWVNGLSLLGLLCASFRGAYPFDAAAAEPEAARIEKELNSMVAETGIRPRFQAVLASPGAVPFFYGPKKAVGATTEEMVRDIHIRLNDDLFFDLAEGRLFQSTPGGLSLQLLSTKHYHRLRRAGKRPGREVLVVTTPHVESGIIFSTDEPLIRSQLEPLLKAAGCNVTVHAAEEAHHEKIGEALAHTEFLLYTGHGGPESLHTHGRFLTRRHLPPLPPLVAYASACSTVSVSPHWYSRTEGLDWEAIDIPAREVIGLAMVEKGAVCFVGGATTEDLQFSTSIYGVFMEALLARGMSVGEAVRETRNFVTLYCSILSRKAPGAYRKYKWGLANTIHQQILLGDPALVPCPVDREIPGFPQRVDPTAGGFRITVSIPEESWSANRAAVSSKDPSKHYYKSKTMEVISPAGKGIVSWGDFYRIAPDAADITEISLMSSYLHLYLDLPRGAAPLRLDLAAVKAAGRECLLCRRPLDKPPVEEAGAAFRKFCVPFLMQPPLPIDMTGGWAFSVEEREDGARVHWLVPVMVIDDKSRTATRAGELVFELKTAPAVEVAGRIDPFPGVEGVSLLVSAGVPPDAANGPEDQNKKEAPAVSVLAQGLARSDGSFALTCAGEASVIAVEEQYPLYELLEPFATFEKETWAVSGEASKVELREVSPGVVNGTIVDSRTGRPLGGALIRAWRGELDPGGDPLVEGFAGEAVSAAGGGFTLALPGGKYLLYAAAAQDGRRYKSKPLTLSVNGGEEQYLVAALDEAAVVKGKVAFQGETPPHPAVVELQKFPAKGAGERLSRVPVRRDGTYECLVGFQDRFSIRIEEEGWLEIKDDNSGQGYRLQPRQELTRDYLLSPSVEDPGPD